MRLPARPVGDEGSAIVEFVFLAIVIMLPLVYLIAAVATIQREQLAVTQAARDAGRAFATSDDASSARRRAQSAMWLALDAQGLPHDATMRFVPAGDTCKTRRRASPELRAGAQFAICVIRHADLPGVPSLLSGHGITTMGEYVVHVDDYRDAG